MSDRKHGGDGPAAAAGHELLGGSEQSTGVFRSLAALSGEAMAIVDMDGVVRWVNDAAVSLCGLGSPEELVGRLAEELTGDAVDIRSAIRDEPLPGDLPREVSTRIRGAGGRTIHLKVTLDVCRDSGGEPLCLVAVARDYTASWRAESALDESREMLRQVLDTIPVRVFWKDRSSVFLGCNWLLAQDAGLSSPDQIIGRTDYDFSFRDQAARYQADDREVMETGIPKLSYEEPQSAPDGSLRWLRTSKIPLRGASGEIVGILGTYEEITQQREAALELNGRNEELLRANAELERLHVAKDEFLAMVSHELRTPLVTGLGYLELLLQGRFGEISSDARSRMEIAHRNLLRLSSLIQNLLRYQSVIQPSRDGGLCLEPVDLSSIVNECLAEFQVRSPEAAGRVMVHVSESLPPVKGDADLLRVVLANLLDNAAHHAGSGAAITVEARPVDDRQVRIVVADTGRGVDPEIMARAFEPFVKSQEESNGSGLGLAIVDGILNAHDSRRTFDSTPGEGTRISFTLPVFDPSNDSPRTPQRTITPVRGVPSPSHVAVVEDDRDTREFLHVALQERGYAVSTTATAEDALQTMDFDLVHLALVDISLPGMDGIQLCRQLKSREDTAHIVVVMLTARAEDSTRRAAEEAGCDAYLVKPVSVDTLIHTVRKRLQRATQR